jgi:CubicO group peptidase (beta-lactamase class C family)
MKRSILFKGAIVLIATLTACGKHPGITRLDGTTITTGEIDATVVRLMRAAEVPGLGIAVLNDGKIAYLKAYGVRDKEKNLPLTVDSAMYAASFSKSVFAYMVMQLVDSGSLDLDKPVYQYLPKPLPEYPSYNDLANDSRINQITARMLLSHTSGLPNWRLFEDDHKLHIHFAPGSRYAYSGEGIVLLQLIVETITKKPLEELMQQLVFQPLGMTRTSMVWQDRFEADFANGYDEYGRSLGADRRTRADAAGSMQTTIADFARFTQAVLNGKGLSKKSREEMLGSQIQITSKREFPTLDDQTTDENKAIRLSYGLGWGLYWTPYGKAFFKEGHSDGEMNYTVCFDTQKTGIVVMTNSANGEGMYKELLEGVLRNTFTPIEWEGFTPYNQLPARIPLKEHRAISVDAVLLQRYAGRYGNQPDEILTIQREGDHLSVQKNDEQKLDLFPESKTDFFSKTNDYVFTFEVNSKGRATKLTLHTHGLDLPVKRID